MSDQTRELTRALVALLEASRRLVKRRRLAILERRLETAMGRAFRAQGRALVKGLARYRARFPLSEAGPAEPADGGPGFWAALLGAVETATLAAFVRPIQRAARAALSAGATQAAVDLDLSASFTLANPRAVAYLEAHGAELVTGINASTRAAVQRIVTQAAGEGWSYDQTASELRELYAGFAAPKPQAHIASRAHLIAVTETGQAYEAGNYIVGQDLADAGLTIEKAWLTVGDDRVSKGCAENQAAGWIGFDEAFPSGDLHPLRFPGCRCDLVTRVKPAAASEAGRERS